MKDGAASQQGQKRHERNENTLAMDLQLPEPRLILSLDITRIRQLQNKQLLNEPVLEVRRILQAQTLQ